jgi:hypothetical protein
MGCTPWDKRLIVSLFHKMALKASIAAELSVNPAAGNQPCGYVKIGGVQETKELYIHATKIGSLGSCAGYAVRGNRSVRSTYAEGCDQ